MRLSATHRPLLATVLRNDLRKSAIDASALCGRSGSELSPD
ncbi:MAG: hypothetical protein ACREQN_19555 [Candidatus Binataceae bacterium]